MAKYRRVSKFDRVRIRAFLDAGFSKSQIARRLKMHRATVYREISRESGKRVYDPVRANEKAKTLYRNCRRKQKISGAFRDWILLRLLDGWSPEQICGRLRFEKSEYQISHETIYRFIESDYKAGGRLFELLRRQKIKGRRRRFPRLSRGLSGKPISARPRAAQERTRIGDWERDTMLGKDRKSILVCVDRKSRFTVLAKMENHKAQTSYLTTLKALIGTGKPIHTITNDRGTEFRDDLLMMGIGSMPWEQELIPRVEIYYCDAYAPRQRGTVENTIGLLRQYIPKKAKIERMSPKQLQKYQDKLNSRPRKILAWKTPQEVFNRKTVALAL